MEYRKLGKAGLQLSEIGFGSWLTFGSSLDLEAVKQCMRTAFDLGVNVFDNAEAYGYGASELLMGEAIREYKREQLVITTKIFWSGKGPNQTGLSWKRIVEGTKNSLRRLQLDYVDLLYCHRSDPNTPIEETVRAMDVLIKAGLVFYWGTSEWKRHQIEQAHQIAKEIYATPPAMEQPQYNLFHRERVEEEYQPLIKEGMGITTWSPLEFGILTGKYNKEIPEGTRLALHPELREELTPEKIQKVVALEQIAKEIDCTLAQLAIAWCLKNENISSVLIGASNPYQIRDNLKAAEVKHRLVKEVMEKIEKVISQK